jgi:phosphoribosylformimino-5-aminoimidazole carboxamide ribotide isomerase
MNIYPAIDILGGKVVRLTQGRFEDVTVYNERPVEQARDFEAAGAKILHVVDLDGAVAGEPKNLEAIESIAKGVGIPIQVGGGLRSRNDIERVFDLGVQRAVLGTTLVTQPERVAEAIREHPGRIVAAIDARGGKVHIAGWKEGTDYGVRDIIPDLEMLGVEYLLYTDIGVDGTLAGVDVEDYRGIIQATGMKLIASGGVSTMDDVRALVTLPGLEGVIIGRALYEGTVELADAIAVAQGAGA